MANKLKSANAGPSSSAFAYKHFNATSGKRRKNRKKYFEHDTRTRTLRTTVASSNGAAAIKKIKFNNEINIYEAKNPIKSNADTVNGRKKANATKKRPFRKRRNAGGATAIQTTTKKLQKQLIETQKKLQKQLNVLQEHQREQNNSFLALIHSNCMHASASQKSDDAIHTDHTVQSLSSHSKPNASNSCSENCYHFFMDQSKCSIDKMANGNKATSIRAFTCDSNSKNCSQSADTDDKSFTPPKDLCNYHCSTCIGHQKRVDGQLIDLKKPKTQSKKLKSIILSKSNPPPLNQLNIKQEIDEPNECNRHLKEPHQTAGACITSKVPDSHNKLNMQFSDNKKTKQINSYVKTNDFVQQNQRSYSPPLPATHRLASMVANDAHHTGNSESRPSRSSRDRKSSKKRKKRRRSHSRDSRSRSRSYSKSRSSSRSRSRSRSYHRHSSPSRSSSSDTYSRRRSQDRKKKSHSKNRDVFRRSSKRDERNCGCSCNCTNYCKKASKQSASKTKSKSPSNDSAFSSKQSNVSPSDSKRNKRSTTSSDANGSTSKKKPVAINSSLTLKQHPIVKLHSSPATGSDTENEVDDKFDRKYEELLTFETNEDERREQRLLKALSEIAAKAKQKIQSITNSNETKTVHADRNHNERSPAKGNRALIKNKTRKASVEDRSARNSEERDDNEYSPKERKHLKRASSRRSRRDTSSSSKDERSPRSSRSPSIPRRRGSPSFLDRRRITSARKKPIPYQRSSPYDSYDEWDSS